jgi:tetratricopeptide (TPR) repeat protein
VLKPKDSKGLIIEMIRKIFLLVLIAGISALAHAQTADEVYNTYIDFNEARLNADADRAMTLADKILPDTAKLTQKVRTSFYNLLAKLYEEDDQSIKAIKYYNLVIAAQPNYYIAHRALGYLYIKDIQSKQAVVDIAYITKAKNALPHLEKAQACEPDDNTLAIIKVLYKNLRDEKAIDTLPARMELLKKNCIDLLSDQ